LLTFDLISKSALNDLVRKMLDDVSKHNINNSTHLLTVKQVIGDFDVFKFLILQVWITNDLWFKYLRVFFLLWYLYTWSKNDVISSVRKHYCALGLELG